MTEMTPDIPDQLPARMLNEFTYCPRLFYLEYVQQEWAHSADTLDGRFVHRRVDREEGRVPAAEDLSDQVKLHSRSVLLGSEALGATARVDLIETDEGRVIPVDYKRGRAPEVAEGAYEPERVQLCLQGLLLRENGYTCEEGVLYFASAQERVRVPFTEDLVGRTLALLEEARCVAQAGEIPPPLVNSPKCPRCSLVGICLPDETNILRASQEVSGAAAQAGCGEPRARTGGESRRLIPARDDRLAVYVQGQGLSVGLKGETLEIRDRGKAVSDARLLDTSQLNLFGNVQLSAQALRELAAREIPVLHLSYGGWLTAVTTPPPHKNIELRRRQFAAASDPSGLPTARALVRLRQNTQPADAAAAQRARAARGPALPTRLLAQARRAREFYREPARRRGDGGPRLLRQLRADVQGERR